MTETGTPPAPLRTWVLVVGAAGLAATLLWSNSGSLPKGLTPAGARTLGCAWLMAWWWIGSRLPLAVPSLIPLALFPILGITDSKAAAAPYADRMVMLLLCGFLIAQAVEKWGLHRRVALSVLVAVGKSPASLLAGVMAITAGLSMWISNTATTLMMLPIVLALASTTAEANDPESGRRYTTSLLLALAWAASVGGMATPVGTPPNLLFQGQYAKEFPTAPEIGFADWMAIGVPVALVMLFLIHVLLTRLLYPAPASFQLGERGALKAQLSSLGPMTRPELLVAVGFAITAAAWVLRKPLGFPAAIHDSTIAAVAAIAFFLTPAGDRRLLEWEDAKNVPWGLLLLFGGGIGLSGGFKSSGLTEWLGNNLAFLASWPAIAMVAGLCLAVTFLTELTSNTATTALILPVLAAVAKATGTDPLLLMVPATLAASCAFMLPVATAPNAIVIGSNALDPGEMARAGLWLNLVGVVPITVVVLLLV